MQTLKKRKKEKKEKKKEKKSRAGLLIIDIPSLG